MHSDTEKRYERRGGYWHRGLAVFRVLAVLLALAPAPLAQSQGMSEEAREVLRDAQYKAAQATTRYSDHYPDQPLWREAIALGQRAQRMAPDRPEPYRFLGQVYSVTGWYSRAWDAWQAYLDRGGEVDAQARSQLLGAATWLGFHSFSNGAYRRAIPYLQEALRLNPKDRLTLSRLAQAHLELGEPEEARPYAEALSELDPQATGLLARTESYLAHGVEAVNALLEGEALYGQGRAREALEQFRLAVDRNPQYAEALQRAGQVALELDRPGEAAGYLERLVELQPGDEEARTALRLAVNRDRYGIEAYAAYQEGLAAYQQGDMARAHRRLQAAAAQSPGFADAHAWLGRLLFEQGDFQEALQRFQRAVRLDPDDSDYRFYLSATEQQIVRQEEELARQEELRRAEEEARAQEAQEAAALERARAEAEARARAEAEAEARARAEAAERERAAVEAQAEAEARAQAEAAEREQAEAEAAAERERAAAEQAAAERAAVEEAAAERAAAEQAAAERAAAAEAAAAAEPEPRTEPEQAAPAETAAAAAPAQPAPARPAEAGEALVVVDREVSHESAEAGGTGAFSFLPSPDLTRNLVSPLNYAEGTLHLRLEVLSKPSDKPVHYQLCLVPNDTISVQPACSASDRMVFRSEGVFEAQQPVSSLSGYQAINWGKGMESMILVIKDPSGVPIDNRYLLGDGATESPDASLYYPMSVRFSAVLVPAGASFAGWP